MKTQAPPLPRLLNLRAAMRLRCPRCSEGKLFRGWFQMHETCEHCGLNLEREPGFYLGSIYINYGAAVLLAGSTFAILTLRYRFPPTIVLAGCVTFTTLFPLWFFRYARSLFLAIDYFSNPTRATDEAHRAAPSADTASRFVAAPVMSDHHHDTASLAIPEATAAVAELPLVRPSLPEREAPPAISEAELSALRADDATAGIVVGAIIVCAIVFGLTMISIAVYVSVGMQ